MGLIKNIVDYSDSIVDEARRLENEGLNYKQEFFPKLTIDYLFGQEEKAN